MMGKLILIWLKVVNNLTMTYERIEVNKVNKRTIIIYKLYNDASKTIY